MPKIAARKCPKTGRLFATDEEYGKHIVGLRKRLNEQRPLKIRRRECLQRRKRLHTEIRNDLDSLKDINELENYVKNNFGRIMLAHNGGGEPVIHALLGELKMEEFDLRLRFYENVSNTHSKPRDGVTNWGGRTEGAPRGYPGFSGDISYTLNFNPEDSPKTGNLCLSHSGALAWAGIHTGTGGGRGPRGIHKYEYGVNIYLSDFDGLQKQYFHDKLAGTVNSR